MPRPPMAPADERHWYKDAVLYELHVRSFYDSNADGIGDFRGLAQKLDYLQDLGVSALWLLLFYPSPLNDEAYYWHRFYSHQPDLNFENPKVREAMIQAVDFWMGRMGVDGLRLDAVPYLYERDGTNCENLPETHAFLRELRRHVDERYPDRML